MTSRFVCAYMITLADWPPFGKGCPLGWPYVLFVIMYITILLLFLINEFGFEGRFLVLIEPVPGNC